MIATLGGQPQIVTFALDSFILHEEKPTQIIILALEARNERLKRAYNRLQEELKNHYDQEMGIEWRVLQLHGRPLFDIRSEIEVEAASRQIHQLMARLKQDRQAIHLVVSGGRRFLALLTIAAATLHFDHTDHLWHMYTPDEVLAEAKNGNMMHAPTDSGFTLLEVPTLPLGHYFANLRGLNTVPQSRSRLDQLEMERCRQVVDRLTERQLDVLRAFAEGLTPKEVAKTLYISRATINSHKSVINDLCRQAWGLPDNERLSYSFLYKKFEPFFGNGLIPN